MPVYMDLHIIPDVNAMDVAKAHRLDMLAQNDFQCKCMTYWVDESKGHVYCLIEAPEKEAIIKLHSKAHGLVPNRVIEVQSSLVDSFLGRISDPADAVTTEEGLKYFSESSFRILLAITLNDQVLMKHLWGKEKAQELMKQQVDMVRTELATYNGQEAEYKGHGFIASFTSATQALNCALSIQEKTQALSNEKDTGLRISINAGEPVTKNENLFGDTIQTAERICFIAKDHRIGIAASVKDILIKELLQTDNVFMLSAPDEQLLRLLFDTLEDKFAEPDFNIDVYCQGMVMSKSQLYRKTLTLTGLSPNNLLKEFRLEKARSFMREGNHNITQVTYAAGFSSPSYFTKCFKKKFGITPLAYMDMLH